MSTPTPKPHDAGSHDQQMTPELQRVIDAADKRARDKAAMPAGCTTPSGCRENGCHGECLTPTPEQIIRAAVAAMPHTNPGVADDLIQGFTMHTEAEDIVAIWRAAQGASQDARTSSVAPGGQPLPQADEQSVFDAFPLHECLRLADLWTSGVDLNNEGQWRIVMKVLLDKLRAHGDPVLPPVEPPGATLSPCAASTAITPAIADALAKARVFALCALRRDGYRFTFHDEAERWAELLLESVDNATSQVDRGESSSEGGES